VKVDKDKMNQMGFENPTVTSDATHLLTFCENPRDTDFDPVRFFDFYLSHCHPKARFFYARVGTPKQIEKWSKEYGRPIWYGPAGGLADPKSSAFKLGKSKITDNFKQFARRCGCENWEKHTGQGLRALCITISIQNGLSSTDTARLARHKSIKSQESYERDTKQRIANRYNALQARTLDQDGKPEPSRKRPPQDVLPSIEEEDEELLPPKQEAASRSTSTMNEDQENQEPKFATEREELKWLRQQLKKKTRHNSPREMMAFEPTPPPIHHRSTPVSASFGHCHGPPMVPSNFPNGQNHLAYGYPPHSQGLRVPYDIPPVPHHGPPPVGAITSYYQNTVEYEYVMVPRRTSHVPPPMPPPHNNPHSSHYSHSSHLGHPPTYPPHHGHPPTNPYSRPYYPY
jgi:hypothetical protein